MQKNVFYRARSCLAILVVVIICAGFGGLEQLFAPKAELWPRWQAHNAASNAVIDHHAWGEILKRYIRPGPAGINLFGYGSVTKSDKKKLKNYIATLTKIVVGEHNRREQRAYWINLYNALTVNIVLDYYPVKSILDIDISPGFLADGPWDKKLVNIEGTPVSLNDIEHRILRPIWHDSRIHYAVNCASIGCPNLQNKAYTGANTESLLDLGARQYINSSRGVAIKGDAVVVSKIYNWFQADFGETEQDVLRHLLKYARPQLKGQLQKIGEISDFTYDWNLNAAR